MATRWVYMYVAKQHCRGCSEFNVEFVWRQSTECQKVHVLRWLKSLLVDLCNVVYTETCHNVAENLCLGRGRLCCRPSHYVDTVGL